MARKKRNRGFVARPARRFPQSLGHTAGRSRDSSASLDAEVFSFKPQTVRSPLIRTVLIEPEVLQPPPPRRGSQASPTAQSRATGRSSQKRVRSPFLNATMLTPELTERALVCARRGIRREVLFATKRTGKGSQSPRRFTFKSKMRC